MILLAILAAIVIAVVLIIAIPIITGGALFFTIFGDLIVCIAVIVAIVKVVKYLSKK